MAKINLRNLYPAEKDEWIDVSDEVADLFLEYDHKEAAYQRKIYKYRAYFSLDWNPELEKESCFLEYEKDNEKMNYIKKVISFSMEHLSKQQIRRIYAHFYLGLSKAEIARHEGVTRQSVAISISLGLKKMKKYFEKNEKMT